MDPNTLSNFLLFGLGIATTAVAIILAKNSSKIMRGRSIKEVVDSANAIIELYKNNIGVLENKVGDLEKQVASLETKLDETLKHNEALQKILLSAQPVTVPITVNPVMSP
jgi:peptidoglycan hydrolase CwlO-like protein